MARDAEAALDAARQLLTADVEAPEEESGAPPVVEETPEPPTEFTFPSFSTELPADLLAELDEPEFTPGEQEDDDLAEYEDDSPELVSRLRAAERKAAYYEGLRVADAAKGWKDEASKFFPLSEPFLTEIKATSRRSFLKQAKAAHERMVPLVEEKILGPTRQALESERARITAEARADAERAWGRPAIDATPVPSEVTATREEVDRNRQRGDLAATIKSMIFTKGPQ